MGDTKFGVRYAGCFRDDEIQNLPKNKLTLGECYTKAVENGSQYIILQGGDRCLTVNDFKYEEENYELLDDDQCDSECFDDRSMNCGGALYSASSVYEI